MRTVSPFAACWNKRGGKTDFYPASGYRTSHAGGLSNVGTLGYTWSSAPYSATSVYGSHLSFGSSYVSPEPNYHRAYGFTVRCVQE